MTQNRRNKQLRVYRKMQTKLKQIYVRIEIYGSKILFHNQRNSLDSLCLRTCQSMQNLPCALSQRVACTVVQQPPQIVCLNVIWSEVCGGQKPCTLLGGHTIRILKSKSGAGRKSSKVYSGTLIPFCFL